MALLRNCGSRGGSVNACSDGCDRPCSVGSFTTCSVYFDRYSCRSVSLESVGEVLMTKIGGIKKRPPVGFIVAILLIAAAAIPWYYCRPPVSSIAFTGEH